MTLGLAAWTVLCIAIGLGGSEKAREGNEPVSLYGAFSIAGFIWSFGVGVWLVVEMVL